MTTQALNERTLESRPHVPTRDMRSSASLKRTATNGSRRTSRENEAKGVPRRLLSTSYSLSCWTLTTPKHEPLTTTGTNGYSRSSEQTLPGFKWWLAHWRDWSYWPFVTTPRLRCSFPYPPRYFIGRYLAKCIGTLLYLKCFTEYFRSSTLEPWAVSVPITWMIHLQRVFFRKFNIFYYLPYIPDSLGGSWVVLTTATRRERHSRARWWA